MLFCDVQGSTEAAEKLDPEDWSEIMNGAFEYLIAPIYRYEGTLARLMGDGNLAFFGAPIAHEDDPQRAVLAGLDILREIRSYRDQVRNEWGLEFDVRVGINTGLVVVGEVGSDLRMEYSAQGDAINLASRMESTAKPGTIHVSKNTQKLIAPLFEFEELGDVKIKGKAAPIKTYRVLRAQGKSGRLIGLEGLDASLQGEAFKHELFEVVSEMVRSWTAKQPGVMIFDDLHWADAASVDLLQHLFQLTDQIPLLILAAFRPNRSAASWKARVIAESEFPHRYSEVVVNPLAEEDSLAMVNSLMVISHLPDVIRDQIIQITEGNPFFLEEVLRELLERKAVVVDDEGAHWRAGMDIESARIGIPDNLQALLSARIDRLEEEFRETLQLAAVIGRRFFYRVLEFISDRKEALSSHLGELQRAQLIREAARIPEIEYIFRHALTQEVAYKTILRKQRREFHSRVGETIEQLFGASRTAIM